MMLGAEAGDSFGKRVSFAFNQATAAASTFQIVIGAVIIAITALVAVIHSIKQAQEEAIQASIASAEQYTHEAEEAKKVSDSLEDLIKKYKELAEKNNGTWDDESVKQVQSVQDEIVGLVGDQATGIDLVNGKLAEQYDLLDQIAGKQKQISLDAARSALADARVAIQNAMGKWRSGDNQYFDLGMNAGGWGKPKSYGDIIVEQSARSLMGAGSMVYDGIKVRFDTAEEFAKQYEAVLAYKNEVAKDLDETNTTQKFFYEELNEFLNEYQEVYNTYRTAWDLVDSLTNPPSSPSSDGKGTAGNNAVLKLRTVAAILGEIGDEYDSIVDALSDMEEYGVLTANTFSSMVKDHPELVKYLEDEVGLLEQTADGYILNAKCMLST